MRRSLSVVLTGFALGLINAVSAAGLPPDPAVASLLQQARLWEARNRTDLALLAVEKLFRIAPEHPDGLAMRARIEASLGQAEQAAKTLARLKATQPDHAEIPHIEALLRLSGVDRDKLRQARVLGKSGRTAAALAAMRSLYPGGPPSGDLALEYWELTARLPNGWEAARRGLVRLASEYPDNIRYRLALAEHETSRAPIDRRALRVIVEITRLPEYSRQARAAWRRAIMRLDMVASSLPLLREYLAREAGDSAVQERMQMIQRAVENHRRLMADPDYRAGLEGLALIESGNLEVAEDKLQQSLARRPADAEALGGMGFVRLRQGYHSEAIGYFERARQLDAANSGKWTGLIRTARYWGLLRQAGDAREAGEFVLAADKVAQARAIEPKEPNAIVALALILIAQNRLTEAETGFRQALAIEPDNRSALTGLVDLYLNQGNVAGAERVVANAPLEQRQSLADAIGEFRAGRLRANADRDLAEGRTDAAVANLTDAIRLAPANPWLRYDLARIYLRNGDVAAAETNFNQVLALEPENPAAQSGLVDLYLERGDVASAERVAAKASSTQRQPLVDAIGEYRAGQLRSDADRHVAEGRTEAAIASLTDAIRLAPSNPWPRYDLARIYWRNGDRERGQALFDELLARKPRDALTLYAYALYLDSRDATIPALAALELVPDAERSPGMTSLQRRLWVQARLDQVRAMTRSGLDNAARDALADTERAATGDEESLPDIARAWADAGNLLRARAVIARLPDQPSAVAGALRRAELFFNIESDDLAAGALAQARGAGNFDAAQSARADELERDMALRRADRMRRGGQFGEAHASLVPLLERRPDDIPLRYADARILSGEEHGQSLRLAADHYAHILRVKPDEDDALVALIDTYIQLDARTQALHLIENRLSIERPLSAGARVDLADALRRLDELPRARYQVTEVLNAEPDHPGALALAGQLALSEGRPDLEMHDLRRSLALEQQARARQVPALSISRLRLLAGPGQAAPEPDSSRKSEPGALTASAAIAQDPKSSIEKLALKLDTGFESLLAPKSAAKPVATQVDPASLDDETGGSGGFRRVSDLLDKALTLKLDASLESPFLTTSAAKLVAAQVDPASLAGETGDSGRFRRLSDLLDKQDTDWLSVAIDQRDRVGTDGKSTLRLRETPIEWRTPKDRWGQIVLRADVVQANAGTLDLSNLSSASTFGTALLCQQSPQPCDSAQLPQSAQGVSFDAGIERDDLRVDLGTTPLGFPARTWIGGLRKKGDLGDYSWSLDLSRRPLSSSLLSYAGARDPNTGRVWGGVVANGLRLGLSRDQGGALGAWASLGWHRLTGENVDTNDRIQFMAGGYWRIINEDDRVLTLGVTGMYWRFSKNAGEYTFGHGGYYSPLTYQSLSFPALTWGRRYQRFSYILRAAVSRSRSVAGDAPYYPTSPGLQSAAEALTAVNGIDPHYSGGNGKSMGRSYAIAGEYQVTSHLFIGGRMEKVHSVDYSPNMFVFYLRRSFGAVSAKPVGLPPEPVTPTSQY